MGGARKGRGRCGRGYGGKRRIWEELGREDVDMGGAMEGRGGYERS